jgi:hypothetical protein
VVTVGNTGQVLNLCDACWQNWQRAADKPITAGWVNSGGKTRFIGPTVNTDSSRACLCIVEEATSESRCAELLACGLRTAVETMPTGDAQITILKSSLDAHLPMEAHVQELLAVLDRYDELVRRIQSEAKLSFHLAYAVADTGGWTFSPQLVEALARWPFEIVVAVEAKQQQR